MKKVLVVGFLFGHGWAYSAYSGEHLVADRALLLSLFESITNEMPLDTKEKESPPQDYPNVPTFAVEPCDVSSSMVESECAIQYPLWPWDVETPLVLKGSESIIIALSVEEERLAEELIRILGGEGVELDMEGLRGIKLIRPFPPRESDVNR